jgi:hypothetical protein
MGIAVLQPALHKAVGSLEQLGGLVGVAAGLFGVR